MKLKSLVACLSVAGVSSVMAQDNIQLAEAYVPGLADTVFVTATRAPQALKDTLASTTVITREQIEKSQSRTMFQLLRSVPGLYLRRNGGRGSSTQLSMRGGGAGGTLVLLDGVNIESATLGQASLEQIPIDQIERIEIVRGPKSSLYGSTAMSGVIQIFTRKGTREEKVAYSLGVGSDNTRDGSISASGGTETARYNVTASHVTSDGFDSAYYDDNTSAPSYIRYDDDAYRNSAISLNVEQDLGQGFTAGALLNRSESENEYDSRTAFSLPYATNETMLAVTSLSFTGDRFNSRLQYGNLTERSQQYDELNVADDDFIETQRRTGSWENSLAAADLMTLNFGMDYTREDVDKTVPYGVDSRDNFGGYANSRLDAGMLSWSLGFRHDDNEQFGSKWTGDTAFGWEFVDGITASLSYGTGFKAPSFNDLYWPASQWTAGNPTLQPEETQTYEIGVDAYQEWGMASLHVYKSNVDNLIQWAPTSTGRWQPENIGEVKIRGVEAQLGTRWAAVDWKASYTYEKVTDADSGEELIRKPRRRAALDVDKQLGDFSVGTTLYAQSGGLDSVMGEMQRLSGYGLVDLRLAWLVTPELALRLRVDNVLDKEYEDVIGFNNEERFFMFFVDYTPR